MLHIAHTGFLFLMGSKPIIQIDGRNTMNDLGKKISQKRKDLGMTQIELAEQMMVTRQTVSRWEAGSVYPDIDKIVDIAEILQVSCDYLLKDDIEQEITMTQRSMSPLMKDMVGKVVRFHFFEDELDIDLLNKDCTILSLEGNWLQVQTKEGKEKLISLSSILSIEIKGE